MCIIDKNTHKKGCENLNLYYFYVCTSYKKINFTLQYGWSTLQSEQMYSFKIDNPSNWAVEVELYLFIYPAIYLST